MWIIGGPDAKEKNFECSRGVIYCQVVHGGLPPDKVNGTWFWLDDDIFREDHCIEVTSSLERPALLHVPSTLGQQTCSGEYVLAAGETANGHPLWKQVGGTHWLYSGKNGMWIIGSREVRRMNFDCSRGVIYSKMVHGGVMPDKLGGAWLRLDGSKFKEDAAITIGTKPAVLNVISPKGQRRCEGEYVLVAGQTANGQPLWKQMGGKCWLYSGTAGMWIIAGSDAKRLKFDCSKGLIYCKAQHHGVMPDKVGSVWLRLDGDSFIEDVRINISA